jgi:hypothetical protein
MKVAQWNAINEIKIISARQGFNNHLPKVYMISLTFYNTNGDLLLSTLTHFDIYIC